MIIKWIFINLHQPYVISCTLLYQIFAPRLLVLTDRKLLELWSRKKRWIT